MLKYFHIRNTLDDIIRQRKGEIKLGQRFRLLEHHSLESFKKIKNHKLRFALIGIPESIGILANHGAGGAEQAWQEFLVQLVNQQSNRFLEGSEVLCLGQVETRDLQQRAAELNPKDGQFFTKLRSYCQELDQRVMPVIEAVINAGLVPIVVGGGHNNAFPILKGASRGLGLANGMGCLNLDAHADFRPLEGRHSGNGFSYAFYQGFLQRYFVVGLNEQANSEAMLKNMDLEDRVGYQIYKPHSNPGVNEALQFLSGEGLPIGVEIDLDALAFMPASAFSVSGYTLDQAITFIRKVNQQVRPVYLHLAEGQVKDTERDAVLIGKTLCSLALEFIKTCPE